MNTEARTYKLFAHSADRDIAGKRTQKTALAVCPFCNVTVKLFLWSLHGRGKLCVCGAKFQVSNCLKVVDTGIRVEATRANSPGFPEFEVIAPDGYNFGGPHSLVVHASRDVAVKEAREAVLEKCESECDCKDV